VKEITVQAVEQLGKRNQVRRTGTVASQTKVQNSSVIDQVL